MHMKYLKLFEVFGNDIKIKGEIKIFNKKMGRYINTFKNFLIKETFFDLNADFKKSLNDLSNKDKIS